MNNSFVHRIPQIMGLLLGTRFFTLIFISFALCTFVLFLMGGELDLEEILFDYKIHGIIICSILSIASGGLINQFYDIEKDKMIKPFRFKLQGFIGQRYFLYFYLIFNIISLGIAAFLSWRIFLFFVIYQFLIWLYSHKVSKVYILNNIVYVILTLYPFFGILVYYRYFSLKLFWITFFLFLAMYQIDVVKDLLSHKADRIFGYKTIPVVRGNRRTLIVIIAVTFLNALVSLIVFIFLYPEFYSYYFALSVVLFPTLSMLFYRKKIGYFSMLNFLRIWVVIGVIFMLINEVLEKAGFVRNYCFYNFIEYVSVLF